MRQPIVAFDVSNGIGVLAAIDFNDQSRFETEEIRDVWPDRNLPTELEGCKPPILQGKPELALGIRHARAQFAGCPGERPRPLTRPAPSAQATLSREGRGINPLRSSSCDLPGGAFLGILDDNAHRCELVADAIGFLEILRARAAVARLLRDLNIYLDFCP